MNIEIKLLTETAKIPTKATKLSAGYDIYSDEDVYVWKDKVTAIRTGWAVKVPFGYKLEFVPRSGLAFNEGITIINSPGTIDADFLLGTKVGLIGHVKEKVFLPQGSRIAQMMLIETTDMDFIEVKELSGDATTHIGFGSTGS